MKWANLRKGDVIHYAFSDINESYLMLVNPQPDGNYVRYRVLCLDNGLVYDDMNWANDNIPNLRITVERAGR